MNEEEFLTLYSRTARPLKAYLTRLLSSASLADDLLQESYLRFLGAKLPTASPDYQKNYLFRIATNLARDEAMRRKPVELLDCASKETLADDMNRKRDVDRLMGELKPRERELLLLAYVERLSHRDIAAAVGVKTDSIRPLLARAREHFASLVRKSGLELVRAAEEVR
jgi:RNA polymerase sigma-70 factor (ECF subfamily)